MRGPLAMTDGMYIRIIEFFSRLRPRLRTEPLGYVIGGCSNIVVAVRLRGGMANSPGSRPDSVL